LCEWGDVGQAVEELLRYDVAWLEREIRSQKHTCMVCFEEKPGCEFVRLQACGHHCCHECLSHLCSINVADGNLSSLKCPDLKCGAWLPPQTLKDILPLDQYERWERLSLQKALDSMSDMVYCPRCEERGEETVGVLFVKRYALLVGRGLAESHP
jgi:E3 ubiquitin-protein ligase RNF14